MNRRTAIVAVGILLLVATGCVQSTIRPVASTLPGPESTQPGAGSPQPSREPVVPYLPIGISSPSAAPQVVWTVAAAAPMLRARDGFRVVILGEGSLLVVGDDQACMPGPASPGSETAERYDPVADAWSVAAPLNKPRKDFAMVATLDGGAMVVGGINEAGQPFSSTKRFDLLTRRWSDGPLTRVAYGDPAAALVDDGRIYVAGPTILGETASTSTVETLAPGGAGWNGAGAILDLSVSDLVRLSDGRLAAIGSTFESFELVYVLDLGGVDRWLRLPLTGLDGVDELLPLPGGGIVAFGWAYDPAIGDTGGAMSRRYDPATRTWSSTRPMATPRPGRSGPSCTTGACSSPGASRARATRGGARSCARARSTIRPPTAGRPDRTCSARAMVEGP